MILTQNHIIEIAAFISSLIFWNTLKKSKLRLMPFFLFFIIVVEILGTYLVKIKRVANIELYNISIPIEYLFYLFLFSRHGSTLLRSYTLFSIIFYVIACIFWHATMEGAKLNAYILLSGQILTIMACCFYVYQLFKNVETELSLWKNYFFWITAALLLFNLGEGSYTALSPLFDKYHWDDKRLYFKLINGNLLLLLYATYIISFFLLKKFNSENA